MGISLRSTIVLVALAAVPATLAAQYSRSPRSITYAPSLGVDTSKIVFAPGGLGMYDTAPGTGEGPEAGPGRTVSLHYTGWLTTGKKFDSSRDRGDPLVFAVGGGQTIRGFEQGVMGMKKGAKRMLVIPPSLGYGNQAQGDIPPGSTLVFEVEVVDVR